MAAVSSASDDSTGSGAPPKSRPLSQPASSRIRVRRTNPSMELRMSPQVRGSRAACIFSVGTDVRRGKSGVPRTGSQGLGVHYITWPK